MASRFYSRNYFVDAVLKVLPSPNSPLPSPASHATIMRRRYCPMCSMHHCWGPTCLETSTIQSPRSYSAQINQQSILCSYLM